jgi:hypothetical protein
MNSEAMGTLIGTIVLATVSGLWVGMLAVWIFGGGGDNGM